MEVNDLVTIDEIKLSLVEVEERLVLLRQELTVLAATEEDDGLAAQLDVFDVLPGKLRPVMLGERDFFSFFFFFSFQTKKSFVCV
jgi:hypothetical protein